MHSYLRAIGFANITKESEVEKLLEDVYKKFDHREAVREDDTAFIEMEKEFAPDMGIKLCGDVDGDGFHRQYYFPYYKGRSVTTSEEVSVERRVNGDSFAGICDDGRVGVSLISAECGQVSPGTDPESVERDSGHDDIHRFVIWRKNFVPGGKKSVCGKYGF